MYFSAHNVNFLYFSSYLRRVFLRAQLCQFSLFLLLPQACISPRTIMSIFPMSPLTSGVYFSAHNYVNFPFFFSNLRRVFLRPQLYQVSLFLLLPQACISPPTIMSIFPFSSLISGVYFSAHNYVNFPFFFSNLWRVFLRPQLYQFSLFLLLPQACISPPTIISIFPISPRTSGVYFSAHSYANFPYFSSYLRRVFLAHNYVNFSLFLLLPQACISPRTIMSIFFISPLTSGVYFSAHNYANFPLFLRLPQACISPLTIMSIFFISPLTSGVYFSAHNYVNFPLFLLLPQACISPPTIISIFSISPRTSSVYFSAHSYANFPYFFSYLRRVFLRSQLCQFFPISPLTSSVYFSVHNYVNFLYFSSYLRRVFLRSQLCQFSPISPLTSSVYFSAHNYVDFLYFSSYLRRVFLRPHLCQFSPISPLTSGVYFFAHNYVNFPLFLRLPQACISPSTIVNFPLFLLLPQACISSPTIMSIFTYFSAYLRRVFLRPQLSIFPYFSAYLRRVFLRPQLCQFSPISPLTSGVYFSAHNYVNFPLFLRLPQVCISPPTIMSIFPLFLRLPQACISPPTIMSIFPISPLTSGVYFSAHNYVNFPLFLRLPQACISPPTGAHRAEVLRHNWPAATRPSRRLGRSLRSSSLVSTGMRAASKSTSVRCPGCLWRLTVIKR